MKTKFVSPERMADMLWMSDRVADRAEEIADSYKKLTGDAALREFARVLRHANAAVSNQFELKAK